MRRKEDYVDTSIWLGELFEKSRNCRSIIRSANLRHKNNLVISDFVLSESMIKILVKTNFSQLQKNILLESIVGIISALTNKNSLRIAKLENSKIDCELIKQLQETERNLTYDDALHLCIAIKEHCQKFVTTDTLFDASGKRGSRALLNHLKKEHNLKIKYVELA